MTGNGDEQTGFSNLGKGVSVEEKKGRGLVKFPKNFGCFRHVHVRPGCRFLVDRFCHVVSV